MSSVNSIGGGGLFHQNRGVFQPVIFISCSLPVGHLSTYQMYETSSCEPCAYEDRTQVHQLDGIAG